MRILISGNGRTCSNWLLASMGGTGLFELYHRVEDRGVYRRRELHKDYLSKVCIENKGIDEDLFRELLGKHEDLRILWCIRHPVATAMAKIKRGSTSEGVPKAVDATPEEACKWVMKSYNMFKALSDTAKVIGVRQEGLILNGLQTIKDIFTVLGITGHNDDYCERILMNFKKTGNSGQMARYGDKIDISQAYIHENPETAYDGFFKDRTEDIEYIKNTLGHLVEKYYA